MTTTTTMPRCQRCRRRCEHDDRRRRGTKTAGEDYLLKQQELVGRRRQASSFFFLMDLVGVEGRSFAGHKLFVCFCASFVLCAVGCFGGLHNHLPRLGRYYYCSRCMQQATRTVMEPFIHGSSFFVSSVGGGRYQSQGCHCSPRCFRW